MESAITYTYDEKILCTSVTRATVQSTEPNLALRTIARLQQATSRIVLPRRVMVAILWKVVMHFGRKIQVITTTVGEVIFFSVKYVNKTFKVILQ